MINLYSFFIIDILIFVCYYQNIKGGLKQAEEEAKTVVQQQKRNTPFSDEALDTVWQTYIASHPTAHILVNTMRTARPQRIEGNRFVITVENKGQVDLMNDSMPNIISYLADQLSNDFITFEVVENEGVSSPYVWNTREVYAYIAQKPHMQDFIKRFELSLG